MASTGATEMLSQLQMEHSTAAQNGSLVFTGSDSGMPYRVVVDGSEEDRAQIGSAMRHLFDTVDRELNVWRPDGIIAEFNRNPISDWMPATDAVLEVFSEVDWLHANTGKLFDPTVHSIARRKGFFMPNGSSEPALLTPTEGKRKAIGWQYVEHNAAKKAIRRTRDVEIDLSGVAKGWWVDNMLACLIQLGFNEAYVEWGGDVSCTGVWDVTLTRPGCFRECESRAGSGRSPHAGHPACKTGAVGKITVANTSIATSGDYTKMASGMFNKNAIHPFREDAQQITPCSISSATVSSASCMRADGLATAFMLFSSYAEIEKTFLRLDPSIAGLSDSRGPSEASASGDESLGVYHSLEGAVVLTRGGAKELGCEDIRTFGNLSALSPLDPVAEHPTPAAPPTAAGSSRGRMTPPPRPVGSRSVSPAPRGSGGPSSNANKPGGGEGGNQTSEKLNLARLQNHVHCRDLLKTVPKQLYWLEIPGQFAKGVVRGHDEAQPLGCVISSFVVLPGRGSYFFCLMKPSLLQAVIEECCLRARKGEGAPLVVSVHALNEAPPVPLPAGYAPKKAADQRLRPLLHYRATVTRVEEFGDHIAVFAKGVEEGAWRGPGPVTCVMRQHARAQEVRVTGEVMDSIRRRPAVHCSREPEWGHPIIDSTLLCYNMSAKTTVPRRTPVRGLRLLSRVPCLLSFSPCGGCGPFSSFASSGDTLRLHLLDVHQAHLVGKPASEEGDIQKILLRGCPGFALPSEMGFIDCSVASVSPEGVVFASPKNAVALARPASDVLTQALTCGPNGSAEICLGEATVIDPDASQPTFLRTLFVNVALLTAVWLLFYWWVVVPFMMVTYDNDDWD